MKPVNDARSSQPAAALHMFINVLRTVHLMSGLLFAFPPLDLPCADLLWWTSLSRASKMLVPTSNMPFEMPMYAASTCRMTAANISPKPTRTKPVIRSLYPEFSFERRCALQHNSARSEILVGHVTSWSFAWCVPSPVPSAFSRRAVAIPCKAGAIPLINSSIFGSPSKPTTWKFLSATSVSPSFFTL